MNTPSAIGIDFGGTSVKIGVVQGAEVVDHAPPIATQDYPDAPSLIDDMARSIESLRGRFPDLAAVGAGLCRLPHRHHSQSHQRGGLAHAPLPG